MPGLIHIASRHALVTLLLFILSSTAYADDVLDLIDTMRADFAAPEISSNEALIEQIGGDNHAVIDQSVTPGGSGGYAEIDQNGQSNQASVVQTGDSNRARVDQTGTSNTVSATQDGTGNSLDMAQAGTGNVADLAQTGNWNVFQGAEIGDYNSITATLTGAPATTAIEVGDQNSITVNLDSTAPKVSITIVGSGMSVKAY